MDMTFQEHMIKEAKEQVKLLYQEKGFFFVEIDVVSKKSAENLMNVHMRIREGEKVGIKGIRFSGNKIFSADDLKDQMETNAESWISFIDESGIYKKDILNWICLGWRDTTKIMVIYACVYWNQKLI